MVTIIFAVLHALELAGIGYLIYRKRVKPADIGHGECTVCHAKVARWARPGVCANCG